MEDGRQQGGNTVAMRVTLQTPDGPIRGEVEVDTGPLRLAELVPTALELTDILVSRANRKEEKAGRPISCCAGCGACCRQMVCLSPPECFYLVDYIASMDDQRRAAATERFVRAEEQLERERMIEPFLGPEYDDAQMVTLAQRYFFLGMPCPFLIEESCSIHTHRPVVCREYNVTSPAAWCSDPLRNSIAKVSMPQPLSTPLARLAAELTGEKPRLIPLTLAPLWVSRHEDLHRRTWPGLDLFKRFMELLDELPASR